MRLALYCFKITALISCLVLFILKLTAGVRHHRQSDTSFDYSIQVVPPSNNECYSCASSAYLYFWNQLLMHHYFPPKNFTDRCWQPDIDIGSVPCMSACFTIVEEVYAHGESPNGAIIKHYNFCLSLKFIHFLYFFDFLRMRFASSEVLLHACSMY